MEFISLNKLLYKRCKENFPYSLLILFMILMLVECKLRIRKDDPFGLIQNNWEKNRIEISIPEQKIVNSYHLYNKQEKGVFNIYSDDLKFVEDIKIINEHSNDFFDFKKINKNSGIYTLDIKKILGQEKANFCNFKIIKELDINENGLSIEFFLKNSSKNKLMQESRIIFNFYLNRDEFESRNKENLITDINFYCIEIKNLNEELKKKTVDIEHIKKNSFLNDIDSAINLFKVENIEQNSRKMLLKERELIMDAKGKIDTIVELLQNK